MTFDHKVLKIVSKVTPPRPTPVLGKHLATAASAWDLSSSRKSPEVKEWLRAESPFTQIPGLGYNLSAF